jgi:PIN domain nuclease of toxin-antitoxin system
MDYLIDTHAVIWFITDNKSLPSKIKKLIEDIENNCFVSIATFWEIAIKKFLGRLDLGAELEVIFKLIEQSGFEILPITINHILENSSLEHHHHDPFDRLMIAQAKCENLKIVTKDQFFGSYNVPLVWKK